MSTFVLVPGAAAGPELWTPVVERLSGLGHLALPVELPCEDETAGLDAYVEAITAAVGDPRAPVVMVGHSFGAFAASAACAQITVDMLVLVQGMVPTPHETPGQWWANTGISPTGDGNDALATFQHDVPARFRPYAVSSARTQSAAPFGDPWPLSRWPDLPTRYVLCTEDRFFDPNTLRHVVRERLALTPDEIATGHLPMLARPDELTACLVDYSTEAGTHA